LVFGPQGLLPAFFQLCADQAVFRLDGIELSSRPLTLITSLLERQFQRLDFLVVLLTPFFRRLQGRLQGGWLQG